MKNGFLSSPILAIPATARPGITLDELNALRRLAQAATDRALRHDAQSGNATREWIEKSEKLHALADSTFEAYRLAYFAPPVPNPQRVGLLDRYAANIPARFAKDARKAYALTQQAATVSSQRPNETAHGYAMRIADGA